MAFTGISYGQPITPDDFRATKRAAQNIVTTKTIPGPLWTKSVTSQYEKDLEFMVAARKHVGTLSFTHWVSVHGCAPNSHVALYVLPVWCPPIFHRAEMLPTLLEIMQGSLKAGEFIYDIEQF